MIKMHEKDYQNTKKDYQFLSFDSLFTQLSTFSGFRTVPAEEFIDEVEVLVSHENAVAAQQSVHLDEVHTATRNEATHTVETGGHRRAVGGEDAQSHHAGLATGGSRQGGESADGLSLALRAGQLLMHHLMLVHNEEYRVLPAVMPGHEEIGDIANDEEDGYEQQKAFRDAPHTLEVSIPATCTDEQDEQPDQTEADGNHPIHIEEDARVPEHRHVVHPPVFPVGTLHGVRRTNVDRISCGIHFSIFP